MRILIFQDTFHPKVDGVVISTELFIAELQRQGHEVCLVAPRHPKDKTEYADNYWLVPSVRFDWIYPGTCLGKFWAGNLAARIKEFKPEIIHSMTEFTLGHFLATYWKNKLNLPRVHTFHTLWHEYLFYIPLVPVALTRLWMRWAAPKAVRKRLKYIIAPSEAMAHSIREDWAVGDFPIAVIPTGLDQSKFKKMNGQRFRSKYNIENHERVILYLGRLGDEKNTQLIVASMAELRKRGEKNIRFVIAGDGPAAYVKKLRAQAKMQELDDIIWTGIVRGQDWLDCYGSADLFLFPSVTETQGLVVLESLAAGVPVVTVEAMGPAQTMLGEKGGLFADNNPEHFADQTQRLLRDPDLYEIKKNEAIELALSFSIENRARELADVYEKVILEDARDRNLPLLDAAS
jgi:1,2-diacylglycerol 3-alpha-glucosyltransferase